MFYQYVFHQNGPSLSDFHDYEPNLEFDDSDLLQQKHPENDDGKDTFFIFYLALIRVGSIGSLFTFMYRCNVFSKC